MVSTISCAKSLQLNSMPPVLFQVSTRCIDSQRASRGRGRREERLGEKGAGWCATYRKEHGSIGQRAMLYMVGVVRWDASENHYCQTRFEQPSWLYNSWACPPLLSCYTLIDIAFICSSEWSSVENWSRSTIMGNGPSPTRATNPTNPARGGD